MSESLRAATSGGKRRKLDFYPTPPLAVRALIPLIADFPDPVWEPAAGSGHIVRNLHLAGRNVLASDIVRRPGYQRDKVTVQDFLTTRQMRGCSIITNPPFQQAAAFISHAHDLGCCHAAFLVKSTFWHAASRAELFRRWPPSDIYALLWRLDFTGAGRPHRDCIWCVWRSRGRGLTRYHLLPRPG